MQILRISKKTFKDRNIQNPHFIKKTNATKKHIQLKYIIKRK